MLLIKVVVIKGFQDLILDNLYFIWEIECFQLNFIVAHPFSYVISANLVQYCKILLFMKFLYYFYPQFVSFAVIFQIDPF